MMFVPDQVGDDLRNKGATDTLGILRNSSNPSTDWTV